jgi:hypothetical protein
MCGNPGPGNPMPEIHFLTIVLNGMPFIRKQWEFMQSLPCRWRWHVVEGAAKLTHDTAWSLKNNAKLANEFHRSGLSHDGTTEFLDSIEGDPRVTLYRRDGLWDGKRMMCEAPLSSIGREVLLWQLDTDEFWSVDVVQDVVRAFSEDPLLQAAQFRCRYFVAPNRILDNVGFYGNDPAVEWRRVWRFQPGDSWKSHEPPVLERQGRDLFEMGHLTAEETGARGWNFLHLAYVTEDQLRFKESYYGYKGAVKGWKELCKVTDDAVMISKYLKWVPAGLWGVYAKEDEIEVVRKIQESEKTPTASSPTICPSIT